MTCDQITPCWIIAKEDIKKLQVIHTIPGSYEYGFSRS